MMMMMVVVVMVVVASFHRNHQKLYIKGHHLFNGREGGREGGRKMRGRGNSQDQSSQFNNIIIEYEWFMQIESSLGGQCFW